MIYVGKIVNTHGVKGEIRIISNFKFKEKVFNPEQTIYIGQNYDEEIITSYRKHKEYHMVTLKGYNNINEILKYKGKKVYIKELNLNEEEYLDEDLIGLEVHYNKEIIGRISDIQKVPNNDLLIIVTKSGEKLIPHNKEFVESIDFKGKRVYIKYMEGLID